jgi:hypothetical protein
MDIETININSKLVPYLICAYNGNRFIQSFGLDQKVLFSNFINKLLTFTQGSNTLNVYAHNLSGFDGIFLMKQLLSFGKVTPLLHNGKLISIKLRINIKGHKGKTILFKDSYLLIPHSLRKLCEAFKIDSIKGYFPFLLNDINYIGEFPPPRLAQSFGDLPSLSWASILKSLYFL